MFVCGFPVEVCPLARHRPDDPTMADRFELAIDGKELANGYSELNIPEEQEERFLGDVGRRGVGRPRGPPGRPRLRARARVRPAADLGDRDRRRPPGHAPRRGEPIRDVILFPLLRPEALG